MRNNTNLFKKWLHENYLIRPSQSQEIYNILFNNHKLKDDIRTIITYLNHYETKSKLRLEPTIINGLGLNILFYTPAPATLEQIKNYLEYIKQSLRSKENIHFTIQEITPTQYELLRTKQHQKII